MRALCLILASAAAVAGCATAPPQQRSAGAEQRLQQLLAGKVAGAGQSCLPTYRTSSDMVVIDDNTVLFRDGSRRVWRTEMRGPCNFLGSSSYALVTRSFGGHAPCSGEIAQVTDLTSGMVASTCVWGDFVPYTMSGG